MNDKNRNLVVRVVTAFSVLPLVLFLVVRGGLYSAILMGAASAVCVGEYYWIVFKRLGPPAWVGVALALTMPLWPVLDPSRTGEWALASVGTAFFFAWIYHLLAGPLPEAPTRSAHLLTGLCYGALGLTALSSVRARPDGLQWVIAALVITWANDTAAYFAGRFLGRRKLYEAVSPNKTWEGFFGGVAGSVGGLFIARAGFFPALTVTDCVALGVLGAVAGPVGDLCESMLKRAYQVKDASKLIPGHGGLLDRIDALLFNAPLVFVYLKAAEWVGG